MSFDAPHFAVPFRLGGTSFAAVEQDSDEEILQCVEAVVRTPLGSRVLDAPDFGIPDPTFRQLGAGASADEIVAAVEEDEPRVSALADVEIDGLVERVRLSYSTGGVRG